MTLVDSKDTLEKFFYFAGLEALVTAIIIALGKSNEGGLYFDLTPLRFATVSFLLLGVVLFTVIGWMWGRNTKVLFWLENYFNRHFTQLLFLTFWFFVLLFSVQFKPIFTLLFSNFKTIDVPNFYAGIYPVLVLGCLIFLELFFALYLTHHSKISLVNRHNLIFFAWMLQCIEMVIRGSEKQTLKGKLARFYDEQKTGIILWLGLLVLWTGIAITQIGIVPDDRYWNIAGVPILPQQLTFVILLFLFLWDMQLVLKASNRHRWLDLSKQRKFFWTVLLVVWVLAVVVWNSQDLKHTYFAPGPYPPNNERYPFSDAQSFDIGSQYFLLGEGLNKGVLTDRPFLMLFFALLHLIGGQKYESVVLVQILFMALIPVYIFLIGWKFHSKTAGFCIALLVIFKEKNAILSATRVSLANSKTLTSEMFTTLLVISLTVFLIFWLESKKGSLLWPILSGGVLGIAIGVRVNSIFLTPVVLLIGFLAFKKFELNRKRWLWGNLAFLLCLTLVVAPYSVENIQKYGAPFWYIKISQAYLRSHETNDGANDQPIKTDQKAVKPEINIDLRSMLEDDIKYSRTISGDAASNISGNFLFLTARHLIHNEIMTLLIYPLSMQAVALEIMVDRPFWDDNIDWEGQLESYEIFFLGINLFILSCGIGYSVRQRGIIGAIPLLIHLGYSLTNAGARTSGGRYIVPVDWVIHLYFMLGVISLLYSLRNRQSSRMEHQQLSIIRGERFYSILLLVVFLGVGSSFLLSGQFKAEHELVTGRRGLANIERTDLKYKGGTSSYRDVKRFVKFDSGYLATGYVLYPRFFVAGEYFDKFYSIPRSETESMLYFRLLTEKGPKHVSIVLDEAWLNQFANAQYAIVIGCDRDVYIEGKIILPAVGERLPVITASTPELSCD